MTEKINSPSEMIRKTPTNTFNFCIGQHCIKAVAKNMPQYTPGSLTFDSLDLVDLIINERPIINRFRSIFNDSFIGTFYSFTM